MNRKVIVFCLIVLMLSVGVFGLSLAAVQPKATMVVWITGFPNSEGLAMVALHNSETSYKGETGKEALATGRVKVTEQKARVVFENLPYGSYGISLYHDENGNGKLDKNPMGVPKEAYGFSNNAKSLFGKPDYKEIIFKIDSPEKTITIDLN